MALIIKGNMPKGCFDCDYCDMRNYFDGNEWHCACLILRKEVSDDGDKDENCPIVGEIPDEHGDLIDRDEIKLKHDPLYHLFTTAEMLKKEPTIVEASE